MKEWMCWTLLILGVGVIIFVGWWLSSNLPVMTSYYITIVLNFIVSCYLAYEKYK